MNFEVGDRVSFADEEGKGIIIEITDKNHAKVQNSDGFELVYPIKKLVPLPDENDFRLAPNEEIKFIKAKLKSESLNKKKKSLPAQHKQIWEIDLHIEELADDWRSLSNGEILDIQLRKFNSFMATAIEKRIPKVIIIHGKGEGILKTEIRNHLFKYGNMEIHDASYTKYGQGATEVIIHYGR
jgi:hypothetical protein